VAVEAQSLGLDDGSHLLRAATLAGELGLPVPTRVAEGANASAAAEGNCIPLGNRSVSSLNPG
jgi:hypothetical protein